jgi:hypothetical protein
MDDIYKYMDQESPGVRTCQTGHDAFVDIVGDQGCRGGHPSSEEKLVEEALAMPPA